MSLTEPRGDLVSLPERRPMLRRVLRSPGLHGLLALALAGGLLAVGLEQRGGPGAFGNRFGLAAAAVLVPLHAVLAVSPFPSEVLALAHGALYGFGLGWLFTWMGWCLGAALEYALFRRVASDAGEVALARLPRWLQRIPVEHPLFLICGRMVPFGNHAVNALAGVRRIPAWRFAWASALAFLPFSALVAGIASGVLHR